MSDASGHMLGAFLRSRREKLSPKSVGLGVSRRRRTAGLRREEVAERAGIGVDWYIRLEQGRAVRPSAATIDALARALRLTKAEHQHLRALAETARQRRFVRETVPPAIAQLVESINLPAYVTGRRWDVLAWNAAADALFGFSRCADEERNILVLMLATPHGRRLFGESWAGEARRLLALFRATHDLWAGDPAFAALLGRLRVGCPEFETWWSEHEIAGVKAGEKSLISEARGRVSLQYATFQSNDEPDLRLAIYRVSGGGGA